MIKFHFLNDMIAGIIELRMQSVKKSYFSPVNELLKQLGQELNTVLDLILCRLKVFYNHFDFTGCAICGYLKY